MKVKKLIIMLRTLTNQNHKTYKRGLEVPELTEGDMPELK